MLLWPCLNCVGNTESGFQTQQFGNGLSPVLSTGGGSTGGGNGSSGSSPVSPVVVSNPSEPAIAWIGRTLSTDPADPNQVRFSWAGVAFGVHFSGTQLSVTMDDLPSGNGGDDRSGDSYFDVVVDGHPGTSFNLSPTPQSVAVVRGLAAGEHTVWVTKRTEGWIGSVEFHGYDLGGGTLLAPPPRLTRHIEVIGTSTETGYGDLATNCSGYQASQQSQDLAWPQLTANALNAELTDVAYAAKGLVTNFNAASDPTRTTPVIYLDADTNATRNNAWDFSRWKADVVLIDLGGSDLVGNGGSLDPTFDATFVTFIQSILENYPGATIYTVITPTQPANYRTLLETALNSVVATCQSMGLTTVHFFEFTPYTGSDLGCDGHPTPALHQAMMQQLLPQIRTDLGWK